MPGPSDLTLYAESTWMSPWVFHAMIALEEKQLPYKLEVLPMPIPPAAKTALQVKAITGLVPVLVHGEIAISESLAISEYLEEAFPAPDHPALLPVGAASRARARQIMLYLRTSLHALRDARPTSSVFGRPQTRAIPDKAKAEAAELERIALAVIPESGGPMFGAWSLADADLALALMRLVANQDALDRRLTDYALAQFDRKSVRRFVAHLPTSR
ncbi:MAG TPA: glutathione transferase [Kofleriaceae bacterium]|jgi:glutathione S-transferase|nr:glutathione transferase [Kofleriaceae bacterium]